MAFSAMTQPLSTRPRSTFDYFVHFFDRNNLCAATPPDILTSMMNVATSPANQQKVARAAQLLQELLERSLKRGFHGSAELVLSVQDGTIQHIRCRVEQIDK